ncbi:hypothetical protein QQ045_011609 [Rhodiola kirilowii]
MGSLGSRSRSHSYKLSIFVMLIVVLLSSSFLGDARPINELLNESGPSPAIGHKHPSSATLGGIKVKGAGSKLSARSIRHMLGGIKNSGPSPGGEGHRNADSRPLSATLNESGPSPGVGH